MIWVTTDDVILIHERIIQTTGGAEGIRDYAGLEAASPPHSNLLTDKTFFPRK